jgi:hypothetical protein
MASTGLTPAVKNDLVTLDLKSLGSHAYETSCASDEIEKPPALFTEEEMMVRAFRALVMWRSALYFNHPGITITGQLFQATIDRCDAQRGHQSLRCFLNLERGHWTICAFQYFPDRRPLAGRISHVTKSDLTNLRVKYQI